MKNKKGFTLVELLAVLVILALIALITVPTILGMISDSAEQSDKRTIEGYANAITNAIVIINNRFLIHHLPPIYIITTINRGVNRTTNLVIAFA